MSYYTKDIEGSAQKQGSSYAVDPKWKPQVFKSLLDLLLLLWRLRVLVSRMRWIPNFGEKITCFALGKVLIGQGKRVFKNPSTSTFNFLSLTRPMRVVPLSHAQGMYHTATLFCCPAFLDKQCATHPKACCYPTNCELPQVQGNQRRS